MPAERAFDADIDMAKSSIAVIDGITAQMTKRNLLAHLTNAVSRVEPSSVISPMIGNVHDAFRGLIVAMRSQPMGIGASPEVAAAKAAVIERLELLRSELHNCPSSRMNSILGLS